MLARVIAYGAWRREVMFMHFIRLNSSLLSKKICSALDVKSRLSRQRILSQLETAAQCLTYSMCQFEAPGGSSLLKLLVTDLLYRLRFGQSCLYALCGGAAVSYLQKYVQR